ncbi:hypothetical protein HOG98_06390 [bacterium]|jgi:flagellar motor switch protein FliG|nr:hypothetical protein [bacterium]
MLSGKEKAQLLLAAVGSESKVILSRLSEESVAFLTGSIEGAPDASEADYRGLLSEINERIIDKSEESSFSGLDSLDTDEDESSEESDDFAELDEAEGELDDIDDELEDDEILDIEDDFDDETDDIVDSEQPEAEISTEDDDEPGPKMRNPVEIAALLEQQPPQLAAFIFSKLNSNQRNRVSEFASENLRMTLDLTKVEKNPMDEKVFAAVYDEIFMPEEDTDTSFDNDLDA